MTEAGERFASDREWLAAQPTMDPWDAGTARVTAELDRWVGVYVPEVGAPSPSADEAHGYADALWRCWARHWHAATDQGKKKADGWAVAARLAAVRPRFGGSLLRDVVFARAMLFRHEPTIRRFEAEYRTNTANACEPGAKYRKDEVPEWWPELLGALIGADGRRAKLASYYGSFPLGRWLITIATNHRHDLHRRVVRGGPLLGDEQDRVVDNRAALVDCAELLAARVAEALTQLDPEARLVLACVADGRTGNEIARQVGRAAGTISRWKEDALTLLREALTAHAGASLRECADELIGTGHGLELADALVAALRGTGEKRS